MAQVEAGDIITTAQAKTLTGLFLERVRRTPDAVAHLHCDPQSQQWIETTWRDTAEAVGRWQAALRREEFDPGERVALMMSNRREWAWFDMAALGLGLVTVPLYTSDRPENVRHILEDAGVRLLLLESAEQLEQLAPVKSALENLDRILVLDPDQGGNLEGAAATAVEDWLAGAEGEVSDAVAQPDDLATIVYTSGTTGPPKGVMLSHRNILWDTEASLHTVRVFPHDRFLSFLPLSHTLERTGGYYLPMMAGSSVAYARSVPQLAEDLQSVRPTIIIAVPRIFEKVYGRIQAKLEDEPAAARRLFAAAVKPGWNRFEHSQGRRPWSVDLLMAPLLDFLVGRKVRARLGGRLRIAVSGGAPIASQIARFFISLGVPLVQGYGLTETSPVLTVSPLADNVAESVGIPLPGVEVRIGDKDELIVRSPGVMLGYWNQPAATAAMINQDGWLHTGDQARIENNHVFITGRLKEVIVLSNGEKIAPSDLETAIATDSLFSQVLVIGEGRPCLAALVALDPDRYATLAGTEGLESDPAAERRSQKLEAILLARAAECLRGFPGYAKIPRIAVAERPWSIEDGLMTPTMKLKRERILALYRDDVERLYEGHA